MTDFYLKFKDEAEANSVLYTVTPEVTDEEGKVVTEAVSKPNYANIDVLGIIYEPQEPSGVTDEPVAPVALDGWHVNVRAVGDENTSVLQQYSVSPSTPIRVWG